MWTEPRRIWEGRKDIPGKKTMYWGKKVKIKVKNKLRKRSHLGQRSCSFKKKKCTCKHLKNCISEQEARSGWLQKSVPISYPAAKASTPSPSAPSLLLLATKPNPLLDPQPLVPPLVLLLSSISRTLWTCSHAPRTVGLGSSVPLSCAAHHPLPPLHLWL